MKTPIHRDARLDDLDAQQFAAMLASKSWRIYHDRLQSMLARIAQACVTGKDLVELRRAQGGAEALRSVLAVPQTLLEEMKKRPRGDE